MARNNPTALPAALPAALPVNAALSGSRLPASLDRFEGRHYGGLAASLALHFIVLMSMWWTAKTPRPPKPMLLEVEIIQAEPIRAASRATPSKSAKLSIKESKFKQKPPKLKQQKLPKPQEPAPEMREYEMDATVVKAGKRGSRSRRRVAKVALPDVSRPVAMASAADRSQPHFSRAQSRQLPEQTAAASLQNSEQRGTLKPRLSSVGQQSSSRMQLPARVGVESENGPKLIASNAPAAQTLAPQYRHSARPDGKYSSQGGAANPAMGGGPTSESAQAHSLQSSNLAGSPAGNPNAPRNVGTQGKTAARGVGLSSGPVLAGVAQAGAAKGIGSNVAAPTEVRSSGGQREVATTGAPINPLAINSAGGTGNKGAGNKTAAAGAGSAPTTGGDASQPGGRGGSSRMAEGGGAGQLLSASGAGRGIAPTARSMSASIVPDGVGSSTARQADASGSAPMQQIQAQGTAYAAEERYAAKEVQAYSPKSVCELPMMMAGFDRRPLPEGLASIMGSESAMVMETPPVLLPGNIQPTYPLAALGSRLQGKIVLRTQVLTNGQVGEVFVRESNNQSPILSQAAIGTVRNWRFKPAQRNGKPVPAWVNIPIEYRNPS